MRCCALRAVYFDGGFRPPTPGYFLLSRQKKLTKEKATRLPRPAGSLRVSPESALAYAPSLARRRGPAIPGGSPSGLIRFGLRCSARQTGGRRKVKIKTAPFPVGCAPRTVSFGWHGIGAQCAPYIVMCARSAHTLGAMPQASRLCLSNPFVSPSTQPGAELPAGGAPWMARILPSAQGRAVGRTRPGRVAQGTALAARHRGGLSFGYFSLAVQRKVTRRRGTESPA
jgi:hypothetical protein